MKSTENTCTTYKVQLLSTSIFASYFEPHELIARNSNVPSRSVVSSTSTPANGASNGGGGVAMINSESSTSEDLGAVQGPGGIGSYLSRDVGFEM